MFVVFWTCVSGEVVGKSWGSNYLLKWFYLTMTEDMAGATCNARFMGRVQKNKHALAPRLASPNQPGTKGAPRAACCRLTVF